MRTSAQRVCVSYLVLLLVLCGQRPSAQSATAETVKRQEGHPFAATVDGVMPGFLREFGVPGAAVALIRKGEVVWMRGYGFANAANRTPVTSATVFNVGSISKSPTAWAVMRLVESGKVELDRPVDFYLKRCRAAFALWKEAASKAENRHGATGPQYRA